MDDIDEITSVQTNHSIRKNRIEDIDSETELQSRILNKDEPKPILSQSRQLVETLRNIDKKAQGKLRLPLANSRNVASVRIVPDFPSNRSDSSRSRKSSKKDDRSDRSYRVPILSRRPDKNMSDSERAYVWRMKFQRLNARNPNIPVPDTQNPETLEKLYLEAIKTDHYSSSTSTWLIYMGLGYGAFQLALHKFGIKMPDNFVFIQLEVMTHYPQILKELGSPGGPSLGSSWPPWLKLIFVMAIHTLIFMIIYKMTGSSDSAYNAQRVICGTGLMGGKDRSDELEPEKDNAMANVGGLLGGLLGGNSGSGGFGNMFQSILGSFMGGGSDNVKEMDLENPPEPVSDRSLSSNRVSLSRAKTPFD